MSKDITDADYDKILKDSDSRAKKFTELFEIKCKKCGSQDVELFGRCDMSCVYYQGESGSISAIIKCHACGNAKAFDNMPNGYACVEKLE